MVRPPVRATLLTALIAGSLTGVLVPGAHAALGGGGAAALAPGSWSVQFSVLPDFTLGSYAGSNLSLKRHVRSGNALRFGVSLGFDNNSDDLTDVAVDPNSTLTQVSTNDGSVWSIGVNGYYLWYTDKAAPIHAYWGTGPTISWSRRHDERLQSQTNAPSGGPSQTSQITDDINVRNWRAGVAAAAGVEWLVARRIGLFAEYGSSLEYISNVNERHSVNELTGAPPRTDDFEATSHRWDFGGGGGRLGVSVYY